MGHTITSYLDDMLMCSSSQSGCYSCLNDTIHLLQKLGFCINEKSELVPTTCIEYLRNVIDSVAMNINLPERRRVKILHQCSLLVNKYKPKIRTVARVTGLLVAATSAVELGKLHYRRI